ncbi:Transmembrane protein 68 [Paragonimus heterotremus]|uniref:Transmembrane protein 68 n=1 Tax=Paragonimus heterotremus TaxID=100268 RepID=A0A8J4T907_9TREM|nr:Transmembrane protein 68 [Paragonimus heterotremus]
MCFLNGMRLTLLLYLCLAFCLADTATSPSIWQTMRAVYSGDTNWTSLLPIEWIEKALSIPGSGYVIAFVYWLRHPILLCFLLPMLTILFVYLTVLIVHLYRLRWWLAAQLTRWWPTPDVHRHGSRYSLIDRTQLASLAQLLKRLIAALWDAHGRIFHAYEVIGMEKLPMHGPAYVVYYHGTCPFDAYYLISRFCIERDRFPVAVVDRFLFRLPGMRYVLDILGAIEGTVTECASHLNPSLRPGYPHVESDEENPDGCILLVAPGGVREALFADEFYSVLWGKRQGFAKVAILARQPIYPMFTENIRETIRVVQFGKSIWRKLYELTRLPVALFYGYFPVKLRTYIGDPIYPVDGETPEQLAVRTREAVERLISMHQHTPSNLFCALLQRIPMFDRWLERRKRTQYSDRDS